MASKRHLEPLDAVVFHKLPRPETEPGLGIPSMLCKPNPLPTTGPETQLSYKGSYLSCPRAEAPLLHCLLHRPQSPAGRPGAEQGREHPAWDLLVARDKWPSHQGHPFVLKKQPAVPKPVYPAPLCFSPLGSRGGDGLQRGAGAVPAVPPASPGPFSPYFAAFEKYHDQGKAPEIPGRIQEPWPPAQRDQPPPCYPQPPYPQPPGSLSSYKAFGFAPKSPPFPGTYLKPPTPQSYYPSPSDAFVPRPAGPGTLKAVGPPRDPDPLPAAGFLHPGAAFPFSPREHRGDGQVEAHGGRAVTRHGSAFQPVRALQKVPEGLPGPCPKVDAGCGVDAAVTATPRQHHVVNGDAGGVGDATKEPHAPCAATCPQERPRDWHSGDVSPPSPPMPVINNVFSLAPYREYLEGTDGSAAVPKDTPPQNAGSGWEPVGIKVTSSPLRGEGENCHLRVPEGPKAKPTSPEPPAMSPPGLQDSGGDPLSPGDVALDLSLKKSPVTAGSAYTEGTLDAADKEGPPGPQVLAGEDTRRQVPLQLVEVSAGDRSHFQSSATFMFKKYKILRSWGPPCTPQPSSPPPPSPPGPSAPQGPCHHPKPMDVSPALPPAPLPTPSPIPAQPSLASQGFSALHMSLCHVISRSVSASSPELLRDWLRRTELGDALPETPRSPPKPKNGSKLPEPQKPPKGKEIWLAFRDVAALLSKLLAQLEAFTFTRKCPFPYVVRAGAIFIPIHVVKEKLFPELPGASVDQVLQEHRVELRPTTLSEEKLLRELELKGCTSRMLKLLALKQLPDIYPDLLNLLWHHSIRQQLGSRAEAGQ